MLTIKSGPSGCRIAGLQLQAWIAVHIAEQVYAARKLDLIWTCGTDSKHMPGSLHFVGLAVDLGMPPAALAPGIMADLKARLGDDYDVVEEAGATGGPHIHIEFQPKRAINK